MSSAWIYQDPKQVAKHGEKAASWYVGWIDPEGKRRCMSCGPGEEGQRNAEKLRKKREAELLTGTYQSAAKKTWEEFREEYERRILDGMEPRTRTLTLQALAHFERLVNPKRIATAIPQANDLVVDAHFERLVNPKRIATLKTQTIDEYIAKRKPEDGRRKGDLVSPATVSKELRHIWAVLNVAVEWNYLAKCPKFRMLRQPVQLPTYITPEHFAAIYQACDSATMPGDQPYSAADWWRGVLVTCYMTGWRIGEVLALKREDLDLANGLAVTRWEDNKGKRDAAVKLHQVVIDHLKQLPGFTPTVFPWNHNERTLYTEFARIQEAAGIKLPCHEKHEHTRFCFVYGFHDSRRAFATMNADKLSADALQALMRHKSYQTTQRYINMARQLDDAVAGLHVPEVLKKGMG